MLLEGTGRGQLFDLTYKGCHLAPKDLLSDYLPAVAGYPLVTAKYFDAEPGWSGHVRIKTLTRKFFFIACKSTDSVRSVKVKIQDREGIPVYQQRQIMLQLDTRLQDDTTLSHYFIPEEATIVLVLNLRGEDVVQLPLLPM